MAPGTGLLVWRGPTLPGGRAAAQPSPPAPPGRRLNRSPAQAPAWRFRGGGGHAGRPHPHPHPPPPPPRPMRMLLCSAPSASSANATFTSRGRRRPCWPPASGLNHGPLVPWPVGDAGCHVCSLGIRPGRPRAAMSGSSAAGRRGCEEGHPLLPAVSPASSPTCAAGLSLWAAWRFLLRKQDATSSRKSAWPLPPRGALSEPPGPPCVPHPDTASSGSPRGQTSTDLTAPALGAELSGESWSASSSRCFAHGGPAVVGGYVGATCCPTSFPGANPHSGPITWLLLLPFHGAGRLRLRSRSPGQLARGGRAGV